MPVTPAQDLALEQLSSKLEQLEWENDIHPEHDDSLLFVGNSEDGPVMGSILADGKVVYYTNDPG